MPALFTPTRIFYVAINNMAGLTDVQLYIKRPDLVLEGPFTMTEIVDPQVSGTYYYDYTPVQQGSYLSICDSVSQPKRAERSFEVFLKSPFAVF